MLIMGGGSSKQAKVCSQARDALLQAVDCANVAVLQGISFKSLPACCRAKGELTELKKLICCPEVPEHCSGAEGSTLLNLADALVKVIQNPKSLALERNPARAKEALLIAQNALQAWVPGQAIAPQQLESIGWATRQLNQLFASAASVQPLPGSRTAVPFIEPSMADGSRRSARQPLFSLSEQDPAI